MRLSSLSQIRRIKMKNQKMLTRKSNRKANQRNKKERKLIQSTQSLATGKSKK